MHPRDVRALSIAAAVLLLSPQVPAQAESKADIKKDIKTEAAMAGAETPAMVTAAKPVNRLPHKLIYPGDPLYSVELAKTGVQGEVKIELVLSTEGKLLSSEIIASSLSAELDKNALAYVNGQSWKLPEALSKESETRYLLSVIFNRDSVLTINLKTCAELGTDLAYFRTVRPQDHAKNVASLELIASLFTVQLIKTRDAAEALKYAEALEAITDDAIAACKAKPDALLIETYVNAARARGIKF